MHPISKFLNFLCVGTVFVCASQAYGQSVDIAQVMSGKTIPLTVSLKTLNTDWRVFSTQGSGLGYAEMMSAAIGGSANSDLYTKGETIAVGSDVYLIVYKPHQEQIDYATLIHGGKPEIKKLTGDTTLDLSLVNLHATVSLNSIRPFNLEEELAASDKSSQALKSLYGGYSERQTLETSSERLEQLSLAMMQYVQDYDEKYPDNMKDPAAVQKAIYPYAKSKDLFIQPGVNKPYLPNPILSKHSLSSIAEPTQMIMFYESVPDADGKRYVAFADGHVKQLTASDWTRLKKLSKIP